MNEPKCVGCTERWELAAEIDGSAWDLTGADVTLTFRDPNNEETFFDSPTDVDVSGAVPFYDNADDLFVIPGYWEYSWFASLAGVEQRTLPKRFKIHPSPDAITYADAIFQAYRTWGTTVPEVSTDELLDQLSTVAADTIQKFIGYPIDTEETTEYYSGDGYTDLVLKRPNVINTVDDPIEVRVDPFGAWGQGPNVFQSTTVQTSGLDYAAILERSGNKGASGLLRRLSTAQATFGSGGGFGGWLNTYGRGTLTLNGGGRRAGWPVGEGNIKVTYTAGWKGAEIPSDLIQAGVNLIAFLVLTAPKGGMITTSETLGKYSYTIGPINLTDTASNALSAAGQLGQTRQLLSRWRDIVI